MEIQKVMILCMVLLSISSFILTCQVEQPVLTYGEKPNEITFSLVADSLCTDSPYISLKNKNTSEHIQMTAFSFLEYNNILEGQVYNKRAYFFRYTVNFNTNYQWSAEGKNRLGPFDFRINDQKTSSESNFIMISDHDLTKNGDPTTNFLATKTNWSLYDGFLHGGDFAYDVQNEKGARGDVYFNNLSTVISRVPYLIVPGNHENFDQAKLFNYRFRMPNFNPNYSNNIYSHIVGRVMFFYINYDMIAKIDPSKYKEYVRYGSELFEKYSKEPSVKWRVVVSHRPMYCGESGKPDCLVNHLYLRPFDELYRKYKVDVYLESHEHMYERLKFMRNWRFVSFPSQLVDGIPVYTDVTEPLEIICGTGGAFEDLIPDIPSYDIQEKKIGGIQSYLDIKVTDTSFQILYKASGNETLLDSVRLQKTLIKLNTETPPPPQQSNSLSTTTIWIIIIVSILSVVVISLIVLYVCKNKSQGGNSTYLPPSKTTSTSIQSLSSKDSNFSKEEENTLHEAL